ncbi:MAG: hypothetical protein D6790_08730 [Caldilineae bacterium]|nr:MAG: hypothetical protein D6790_08730 [Caldilineae bacterium]
MAEKTITVEIPDDWLEGVSEEEITFRQIFRLGLRQYKLERALTLYREGVGSLGYIAERLGLSKRDLIHEARRQGLLPEFTEETVQEELS